VGAGADRRRNEAIAEWGGGLPPSYQPQTIKQPIRGKVSNKQPVHHALKTFLPLR
jgi:hypothetical protein